MSVQIDSLKKSISVDSSVISIDNFRLFELLNEYLVLKEDYGSYVANEVSYYDNLNQIKTNLINFIKSH